MAKTSTKPTRKTDDKSVAVAREIGKNEFWWRTPVGAPVHDKVIPYARHLVQLYGPARQWDRALRSIYQGHGLNQYRTAIERLRASGFNAARLNVTKSVVNTVVSRLSKNRPMPSFVVDDADWSLKRKAKQYRKFILGEMLATDFDIRSKEALRDGAIIGTGITRIDDSGDGEKVFAERVLREELLFDPRETKYGQPRQAFYVHRVARAWLAELYPDCAAEIYRAAPSEYRPNEHDENEVAMRSQNLDDYVDMIETWHLPFSNGQDGHHAGCVDGATLFHEEWEEPRFPIAMYRYTKSLEGVWGTGLVHDLKDVQERINHIVRDLQMNVAAAGRGFFEVNEQNDIPIEMLTGWQPFKLKYRGPKAPQFTAPQPFNPAQLNLLEFFIRQAYDLPGVGQAAATSKSSLGAGASGVALDTQYDIESERFAQEEGQYAEYRMLAAQLYIDASKRVARKRAKQDNRPKYVSGWLRGDAIEKLEHDKVSLDSDQYQLQLEPIGFIPSTRAGKLSAVGQLAQAGIIPQWLAAALFDEPDIARGTRIVNAAFWNCERKMEQLADEDAPQPMPEPYNDLEIELKVAIAYYNNAQAEKAPEAVQERYRNYIEDAKELKAGASAGAAPPADPMAMDPMAAAGGQPGMVPAPGQTIPAMSGGGLPPEMMPPMAA